MKNKKGFTLIELLAVIVILAIIALIATPIVMNVIENARKGAAERSAENYLRAVDTAIMAEKLNGTVSDGVYTVTSTGDLCLGEETTCDKPIEVGVNGDAPKEGSKIAIKNNKVVQNISDNSSQKTTVSVGDYTVEYNEEGKLAATKVIDYGVIVDDIIGQTTTIKYDPVANATCTSGDTCYEWYVLEDKGSEHANVSLIMNKNLEGTTAWGNSEDETPTIALQHLETATSDWAVNASLPTEETIISILPRRYDENNSWLVSNLDNNGEYWLQDLSGNPIDPSASIITYYNPDNTGVSISLDSVGNEHYVRPVITIPKTKLK